MNTRALEALSHPRLTGMGAGLLLGLLGPGLFAAPEGGLAWATEPLHGSFPQSEGVVAGPDGIPVVVTNFGFMQPVTRSDWRWTCDDVTGETLNFSLPVAFVVTDSGRWLLGTTHGLWTSADHCFWEQLSTPDPSLYVTAVVADRVEEGLLWATTSSSGLHNALYVSADAGQSFQEAVFLGDTVTLRGLLQGRSGMPMILIGWEDGLPRLWWSWNDPLNPADWVAQDIPWDGGTSFYPLEADFLTDGVFWLRFSHYEVGEESLVRVDPEGFQTVLTVEGVLDAFASGPAQGELLAGGRQVGLRRSLDGGKTWSEPDYEPEAGCLVTLGLMRYQCTNNLSDGVAVLEKNLVTGEESGLLWFGDVHAPETCPAGSASAIRCDPAWESQKVLAWLDLSPTPGPEGADGGAGGGCGCQSGATIPPSSLPLGASLGLMAALLGLRRRKVGSRPGTKE